MCCRCREEMVAMMQELKDKQEKSQALLEEVSKLPRNINRFASIRSLF